MKNCTGFMTILLVASVCSCKPSDNNKKEADTPKHNTVTVAAGNRQMPPGDYATRSYDLSMYNVPYQLYIFSDTAKGQYISRIELRNQNNKKMLQKTVSIDSIALLYQYPKDNPDRFNFKQDYSLIKTRYHGVRTDNMYFTCTLLKTGDTSHMDIIVKMKYLGSQAGRIWVNAL